MSQSDTGKSNAVLYSETADRFNALNDRWKLLRRIYFGVIFSLTPIIILFLWMLVGYIQKENYIASFFSAVSVVLLVHVVRSFWKDYLRCKWVVEKLYFQMKEIFETEQRYTAFIRYAEAKGDLVRAIKRLDKYAKKHNIQIRKENK